MSSVLKVSDRVAVLNVGGILERLTGGTAMIPAGQQKGATPPRPAGGAKAQDPFVGDPFVPTAPVLEVPKAKLVGRRDTGRA